MRKKFTKLALVVAGVAAFSGMTAGSALADGPGTPGDGVPDMTYKVNSLQHCHDWGKVFTDGLHQYAGYACWSDENGQWYLDLMR
ncbi:MULTISPECIES: hypothetical protein [Streptomyces]|uniref:Secreted protein n=1 Tax=Streptomyces spirodelae TaxID=2812904 RepID=A0ABS3WPL7_9ACTN|nr:MULTISPECIES: hypothetical protein [Streptomyces]MBO8184807.1 hypothetical protein [Streptomyces spirodelae]UNZ19145.1 hypothetical protein HC362_20940 [Streptomyces sp. 891-h]